MTYRQQQQRNIPVKEECQSQTDVKLIQSYLLDTEVRVQQSRLRQSSIKFSNIYSATGLLRPFSDSHLLGQFGKQIKQLKELQFDDKTFAKRLEILQSQINGLLRRDLLFNGSSVGSQQWKSYYQTLNQKQKDIFKLGRQKIYSDLRTDRLQARIDSLEQEVQQLRNALVHSQLALEQNKIYSNLYQRIGQIISNGNKKGKQIEEVFSAQILPIYNQISINLNNLTRTITRDIPVNIRPMVSSLAKQFDRLLKEQQFSEQKLSQTVSSLITNFKAVNGVQYLKSQFDLAQRAEIAEANYKNILAIFNHQVEDLKKDHNLKGEERIDWLLRRLQEENVQLIQINGWINLAKTQLKVIQVGTDDKQLRELIGILAGQFKRVYEKFPELKSHCSAKLVQIFQSQVLIELIEGASIDRLKQIIISQVETVRVDNIYQYQNTKDAKVIFNLRVMIKSLFEELCRVRDKYNIDLILDIEILNMLRQKGFDSVSVEEMIQLFRSPTHYVQVPVVIQNLVYKTQTYEKGVPINRQSPQIFTEQKLQVVPINREVPVYVDRVVENVVLNNVPVQVTTEKMVEVMLNRDVIVDRVVEVVKEVPVIREKVVPLYEREEVVREIEVDRVIRDVEFREVEKIVEIHTQQIVEVEKRVQKIVVRNEIRETIKQVQVRVPYVVTKVEIREVEKKIPYPVYTQRQVQVRVDVAIPIRVPEITFVDVLEYRDRSIVLNNTIEKPVYTELTIEKEIIREVPKEIFIERSHFIKGDIQQVIREVQVFIDRPIIHQTLITKDVQIQKIVPVRISEQIPVIHQVSVPYITQRVKQIEVEKLKIVTATQEKVKPINIDRPVPIIVEKEVIRVEQQFIDRIVQKIVEVPRVVEIQKIVEKIVVVPRIIEKIVEVPKIIQKIVVVYQPVLQIVEIQVPQIIIQQVQVPIEVVVQKTIVVKEKEIEIVQVQRIVQKIVIQERIVQVQVQKRIPYEVIRQVPVEMYRDRIQYQNKQIFQTKIEAIEVQVPFIVQEKVPFVVQKQIVTHEIVQQPVYERLYTQKQKVVIVKEEKLVVKQIIVEKPILVQQAVQIPGPQTIIKVIEPVPVQMIRDKLVTEQVYTQTIKQVVVEIDKIVPIIHEKLVSIPINEIVKSPELIEVPKIVNLVHYKQIAVEVPVREQRVQNTFVQQIKEVERIVEVPVALEVCRQSIKEIVNEIKSFITKQTPKEIRTQVQVYMPNETKFIEIQTAPIIQQLRSHSKQIQIEDRVFERIVEKIVMLPQIVEVVKHIHHISEVNQLGVAVDVDINIQTQKYLGVTTELRKGLFQLLGTFKSNVGRQPDLKNLIIIIQKYLKFIDGWIAFPKLVQIQKEVIKEVEIQKVVLVPTANKQKEASLCYILQKLLNQLKRIKQAHRIPLALEDELMRLFFSEERRGQEDLDLRYSEMQETLKIKFNSFGQWTSSQPFLISSFLQDNFAIKGLIQSANKVQSAQSEEIQNLRIQNQSLLNKYNNILCFNRKMFNDNNSLIKTLEKYRNSIEQEQFEESLRIHRSFYDQLVEGRSTIMVTSLERTQVFNSVLGDKGVDSSIAIQKDSYISELVSKLSKYEAENQIINSKAKRLQIQLTKCTEELNLRSSIIKRLQNDFDSKLERAKKQIGSKQIVEQNRKLQERIKVLDKQLTAQKKSTEKAKKDLQSYNQNNRKDTSQQIQRKDKEIRESKESLQKTKREFQREKLKYKSDLDKAKKDKEKIDEELFQLKKKHSEEIKAIREQQLGGATDKHNQLINENIELRRKSDAIEAEYQKLKRAAIENNSINQKETTKLKIQIEKYQSQKKEWQKHKKIGFMDLPQEAQIVNKNIELQKKIKIIEGESRAKDDTIRGLREQIKILQIQLDAIKKQLEVCEKKCFDSGIKSSLIKSKYVQQGDIGRSPQAQFKTVQQKGSFVSPQSRHSHEERLEQYGSSSSRISQQSGEQRAQTIYKSQMVLREFMDTKHGDDKQRDLYLILVMIKIIEEMEREAQKGNYYSYTPNNININNFNVRKLDKVVIKFGVHIVNKNKGTDGLYLAPEILGGSQPTIKSVVFNLGVILDELIHGSTFFRSMEEIQNLQIQFKVRGEKLNPILKNTLFQMMNKEPTKRLQLLQAKRRLSLQKYITSQGKSVTAMSSTHKYQRKRQE